jgi:hypothetical protein
MPEFRTVDLIVELFERANDVLNIVPSVVDQPLGRAMDRVDELTGRLG